MLVPKNRGFKRQYVYGGSGIFDSIANFFTRLFAGNTAKAIASSAIGVGKSAAKEIGKKALDAGKTAALDAGKKFIEKSVIKALGESSRILTPKSKAILEKHIGIPMQLSPDVIAKKAQSIISKYIDTSADSINSLIDGSGMRRSGIGSAIAIQDLVRKLNTSGSGLKMV